jgi:hypothetical protein
MFLGGESDIRVVFQEVLHRHFVVSGCLLYLVTCGK